MPAVGTLYSVRYVALDYTTGLTDVTLTVTRPDRIAETGYAMTEMPSNPGIYYYDYSLSQVGQYTFTCNSVSVPLKFSQSVTCEILASMVPVCNFEG